MGFLDIFAHISHRWHRFLFRDKAQLAFLEDFYALVNDGIPANRAIEMIADITTGTTHEVALSISQKIAEGQTLAEGMRGWFSINIVEIIHVGEQGGILVETLKSAINTLGRTTGATGTFIAAVAYPIVVILTASLVMVYLKNSVFVQFAAMKPIEMWPQAGRDLINLAGFIQNWWWLVILIIIGIVLFIFRIMTHYIGVYRSFLDTVPPFSLYKKLVAARFMETIGLLVANGLVFKNALQVMQYHATPYLASHLMNMEHLLSKGKGNIADILMTGLVDEKDVMRLRVMAEVKGFEHGLIRMGVRGAENSLKTLNIISKITGGVLLVVGAYLIIVVVKGIYFTGMSMGQ